MTSHVNTLKDAGVDTVIVWFTTGADHATMMRSMAQVNYDPEIVATATILAPAFTELSKPTDWTNTSFAAPLDFETHELNNLTNHSPKEYGEEPPIISAGVTPATARQNTT